MAIRRHANGTVDHDGEYNPWDELDKERAEACYASGGFVWRTGVAYMPEYGIEIVGNEIRRFLRRPGRSVGDGLCYVGRQSST